MKKIHRIGLFSMALVLLLSFTACSQQNETSDTTPKNPLQIWMAKNFGYGGFSGDIQGTFTIHASGPEDLDKVDFYLDDMVIGTDTEPKFALQFQTDNYELGWHEIHAVGILSDGAEISSDVLTREFVSSETTMNFVIPLVGVILAVSLIGVLGPVLMGRRKGSVTIGQYGAAGAAVCKRCGFPFSRNLLSPNIVFGKLERCPHCGKWAIARRAFPAELTDAEERYREAQKETGTVEVDEKDSLRRSLEDSRFDD
jgi:hypothetical protein